MVKLKNFFDSFQLSKKFYLVVKKNIALTYVQRISTTY